MEALKIGCIVLGRLENNCFFLHREGEYETIVVDPSLQGEQIFARLREKGLKVTAILITHGHFDHIMGSNEIRNLSEAKVYACAKEKEILTNPSLNHSDKINHPYVVSVDEWLKDEDEIEVGSMHFRMLETPGHSEGSCCYYFEEDGVLISGDTLFFESVGRTDLETGNTAMLKQSLRRLLALPEEVKVYPGHGEFTTIGHEKEYNPFA